MELNEKSDLLHHTHTHTHARVHTHTQTELSEILCTRRNANDSDLLECYAVLVNCNQHSVSKVSRLRKFSLTLV